MVKCDFCKKKKATKVYKRKRLKDRDLCNKCFGAFINKKGYWNNLKKKKKIESTYDRIRREERERLQRIAENKKALSNNQ